MKRAGRDCWSCSPRAFAALIPALWSCGQAVAQVAAAPSAAPSEPAPVSAGAGPAEPAVVPDPAEHAAPASDPAGPVPPGLPEHYTIELGPEGRIHADGRRLSGDAALPRDARLASARGRFVGAVVFADPRVGEERAQGARQQLREAGFDAVFLVARAAPPPISGAPPPPAVSPGPSQPLASDLVAETAGPKAVSGSVEPESALALKTVGLHVGGASNDEATRQRFVRQFETKFDDFRRCYPLAENRSDENAGFGVDLLIPARGGKPSLRQARSRLRGERFRRCMRDAFVSLRFPRPRVERSITVSYSLIFKPRGD